jgi:hypothetical protein
MNVSFEPIKVNYNIVRISNVVLYFSYRTCIAFMHNGELTISKNVWSVTTGKHLNWISEDKSIRLPYGEFTQKLDKVLSKL